MSAWFPPIPSLRADEVGVAIPRLELVFVIASRRRRRDCPIRGVDMTPTENVSQDFLNCRLFHGNPDPNFLPRFGGGRHYHDYGNAFYCTLDFQSAAEWACLRKEASTSYVYEYDLNVPVGISPEVKVLNFEELEPAYWLSALLQHRVNDDDGYVEELRDRSVAFTEKYPTNCASYDIILGWRANDRHFAIIRDFLSTLISLETATEAILLGDLGRQFVIKSERAYSWLCPNGNASRRTVITGAAYIAHRDRFIEKDRKGRLDYDVLAREARIRAKAQKKRGTSILQVLGW